MRIKGVQFGFWNLVFFIWNFSVFPSAAWSMAQRPPEVPEKIQPAQGALPLTLAECFQLSLKRSETLAIQKEEIEKAKAQFFKATSEALGDVDFVMTHSRQESLAGGSDGTAGSFTDPDRRERKFVITQPLFQGFKALGALTGAGSLKRGEKEKWIRAEELLFLDVARAFYGLQRVKRDLEIVEGIHRLFEERIKELEVREAIGRSRSSEVATARARIKILEAERAHLQGDVQITQSLLEFFIGTDLGSRGLREEKIPEESRQSFEPYLEAAESRPDVEAARQAVKTAWGGVIVTQSELWPKITLEHNQYDRREGLQSEIDWDLLFKIDVPLFRGGENVGKIKEAVSIWRQKKLAYRLAVRQARLDIQESYDQWLASREETRALEEAVKASEENFRLQREDYEHNLVSNLDVLTALESLHETRRSRNRADTQLAESYWNLQVATGKVP